MAASTLVSRIERAAAVLGTTGALTFATYSGHLLAQVKPPASLPQPAGASAPTAKPPAAPTTTALLITGARILDPVAGRYLPVAAVLVENGRIRSITPVTPDPLPPGTQIMAAAGRTIVPGLADVHASAAPATGLEASYFSGMALSQGVTTVRALNLQTTWGVSQRRRVDAGLVRGPRMFVSGRGIDRGARPDLWLVDATSAAVASHEAARQVAAGVNWIAGYDHLPPDIYKALVDATTGTPVRVSARPGAASMADLLLAGVHSIESLAWPLAARSAGDDAAAADRAWTDAPPRALAALATQIARAKITLVPLLAGTLTQAYPEDVAKDATLAWLPEPRRAVLLERALAVTATDVTRARRAWAAKAAFLARFVRSGGRLAIGTGFDVSGYPVPGAGVHVEMSALVRAGLAAPDVIRAATTNAAMLLGIGDAPAALAAGSDADFLIVEGDPLVTIADLSRITHVVRRGELLETPRPGDRPRPAAKD